MRSLCFTVVQRISVTLVHHRNHVWFDAYKAKYMHTAIHDFKN